ncbi:MAG: calcium-binding protein [Cyanobacteria bacterium P01_A01_bin.37]
MATGDRAEDIEERITMKIVVDAYSSDEVALGWYYYLQKTLEFPFTANRITKRRKSPEKIVELVEVTGLAHEDDCEHEILVEIARDGAIFDVPLIQIEAPEADADIQQAIADWHYWVNQGYDWADHDDDFE